MKYLLYAIVLAAHLSSHAGSREDFFQAVPIDAAHVVERVLARGFDPNTLSDDGQSGLYLALKHGSTSVARALIAHRDTQIDAANVHGETPLMMAALRGEMDLVRTLVERGAQVNRPAGTWTPLHYAASGPSPQVVAWLLDRGAGIDARSPNGTTPLMMAARYGSIDSAELLMARGADRSLRNQRQMDAVEFAQGAGRDELARRLAGR